MTKPQKKPPVLKLPKLLRFEQAWHDEQNQLGKKILAELAAEAVANNNIGYRMPDGSVFAGVTPQGEHMFVTPEDLGVTLTFNDAAKRVEALNADKYLGHGDWVVPDLEQLRILHLNQEVGALRGTFTQKTTFSSDYPDWYWSCTVPRGAWSQVWTIHFLDGHEVMDHKGHDRLNCRPVRLVEVKWGLKT